MTTGPFFIPTFNKKLSRLLFYWAFLLVCPAVGLCKDIVVKTETNKMVEISFTAAGTYNDPFNEVELDAIFTTPSGEQLKVPAFWAGGNIWKV